MSSAMLAEAPQPALTGLEGTQTPGPKTLGPSTPQGPLVPLLSSPLPPRLPVPHLSPGELLCPAPGQGAALLSPSQVKPGLGPSYCVLPQGRSEENQEDEQCSKKTLEGSQQLKM